MMGAKLLTLALSFGKIGLFAFGGGHSMLLLIEEVAVEQRGWVTTADYGSMIGMTFLFPGLTAVKLSGMIGYQVAGILGALVAILALNLPGLVLAGAFSGMLFAYREQPWVEKALVATKIAAVVMIAAVLVSFVSGLWSQAAVTPAAVLLAAAFFIAIAIFNQSVFLALVIFLALFMALPWTVPGG